jgi:hypothetical protein
VGYDPNDFDSHLGLARAYFDQGKPGDAYLQAYENAEPLAKTDLTKAQVFFWEAIFLEAIDDPTSAMGARNNWYKLIALPEGAMSAEWRATAFEHLGITPTFTPSPHPSRTPTKSITPRP